MTDSHWVDPVEFFAPTHSRGPMERRETQSEFVSYDGADLDVRFLLYLQHRSHHIASLFCIPNVYLCVDRLRGDGTAQNISFRKSRCDPDTRRERIAAIRAGIIVYGRGKERRLWIPPDFKNIVDRCRKRYVIFNFGIYVSDGLHTGHANAFLLDKETKTIIRFDPSGKGCPRECVASLRTLLPGWAIQRHSHKLPIQHDGTDSFRGMCVTFSLLYILLTLMNPSRSPVEVHTYLHRQSFSALKSWVLRLNRYIADTLRAVPRGTLVRGHEPTIGTVHLQIGNLVRRSGRSPKKRSKTFSHGGTVRPKTPGALSPVRLTLR